MAKYKLLGALNTNKEQWQLKDNDYKIICKSIDLGENYQWLCIEAYYKFLSPWEKDDNVVDMGITPLNSTDFFIWKYKNDKTLTKDYYKFIKA